MVYCLFSYFQWFFLHFHFTAVSSQLATTVYYVFLTRVVLELQVIKFENLNFHTLVCIIVVQGILIIYYRICYFFGQFCLNSPVSYSFEVFIWTSFLNFQILYSHRFLIFLKFFTVVSYFPIIF